MYDYDGILNCNTSKYSPFEIFDNFLFIIFYDDQNLKKKKTALKTKSFLSCVIHF
jgi:hypothetical protein